MEQGQWNNSTIHKIIYRTKVKTLHYNYILEHFENASPYFCTFLANRNAIEKLLAGFNVQPRIDMNQSLI